MAGFEYDESLYTRLSSWGMAELRRVGWGLKPEIKAVSKVQLLNKFREQRVNYEDLDTATISTLCKNAGNSVMGSREALIEVLKEQDRDNIKLARRPSLTQGKLCFACSFAPDLMHPLKTKHRLLILLLQCILTPSICSAFNETGGFHGSGHKPRRLFDLHECGQFRQQKDSKPFADWQEHQVHH